MHTIQVIEIYKNFIQNINLIWKKKDQKLQHKLGK